MTKYMMVRYKVKAGKVEDAKEAIAEFVEAIKANEPGTSVYQSFQDQSDPTVFVHFMNFDDEYDQTIHRKSSYVKKFVDVIYPLCETEPTFMGLQLFKGKPES